LGPDESCWCVWAGERRGRKMTSPARQLPLFHGNENICPVPFFPTARPPSQPALERLSRTVAQRPTFDVPQRKKKTQGSDPTTLLVWPVFLVLRGGCRGIVGESSSDDTTRQNGNESFVGLIEGSAS
jgi:hypothetical protein